MLAECGAVSDREGFAKFSNGCVDGKVGALRYFPMCAAALAAVQHLSAVASRHLSCSFVRRAAGKA